MKRIIRIALIALVSLFVCAVTVAMSCRDDGFTPDYSRHGHSCVIISGNSVRCWGENSLGELGYGHTHGIGDVIRLGDVNVGEAVTQIAIGNRHTCALLDTGNVRCWGGNHHGQLGYGHTNNVGDDESPASAGDVNVGRTVTQIAVGPGHTCALLDTGNVRCWGANSRGQLGYGHRNNVGDDESPASVGDVNVGGTVTQIAVGFEHTCALLDTGNVRCWGANSRGQLGYGHTDRIGDDESPASAGNVNVGGTVTVTQIAAGDQHTCALLDTGNVRCWGANISGQLGYGHRNNVGDDESPASAGNVNVGGTVTVTQIAAGDQHTCALLDTGNVRCWGANISGQLGYGHRNNVGDDESPASIGNVNVGGRVMQIAVGLTISQHTCALLDTGNVRCWGANSRGQLGYGHTNWIGDDETPDSAGDLNMGVPVIKLWGDLLR